MARSGAALFSPQSKLVSLGSGEDNLADFNEYPTDIFQWTEEDKSRQLSSGDKHGVWVGWLWELIKIGAISLSKDKDLVVSKQNYYKLLAVFKKMEALFIHIQTIEKACSDEKVASDEEVVQKYGNEYQAAIDALAESKEELNELNKNITVINKDFVFARVGDFTGERHGDDDSAVDIDIKLIDGGLKLDKLLVGNHDFDFYANVFCRKLALTDRADNCLYDTILVGDDDDGAFSASLHNLGRLIRAGIVTAESVYEKVKKYYLPRLCLIDFVRDKFKGESITFITHAPNTGDDFKFVRRLFAYYEVECDFSDSKSIEIAVNAVNEKFRTWLTSHTFEELQAGLHKPNNPVYDAMCNRNISEVKTTTGVFYLFGHCSRIKGKSARLQRTYLGVDNEAAKGGADPESGQLGKAELYLGHSTFAKTPEKAKVKTAGDDAAAIADKVKAKKRGQAAELPGFFASPAKSPTKTRLAAAPLEELKKNASVRPARAKASQ